MPYLEWEERLETGISVIDGQHKRIVEYINLLFDVCNSEEIDDSKLNEVILQLIDYSLSHFAFEESLLQDSGYPLYNEHVNEHVNFSDKVFGHKSNIEAKDSRAIADSLLKMLKKWLYGHILKEDSKYVEHVKAYLESIADKKQSWLSQKLKKYF